MHFVVKTKLLDKRAKIKALRRSVKNEIMDQQTDPFLRIAELPDATFTWIVYEGTNCVYCVTFSPNLKDVWLKVSEEVILAPGGVNMGVWYDSYEIKLYELPWLK